MVWPYFAIPPGGLAWEYNGKTTKFDIFTKGRYLTTSYKNTTSDQRRDFMMDYSGLLQSRMETVNNIYPWTLYPIRTAWARDWWSAVSKEFKRLTPAQQNAFIQESLEDAWHMIITTNNTLRDKHKAPVTEAMRKGINCAVGEFAVIHTQDKDNQRTMPRPQAMVSGLQQSLEQPSASLLETLGGGKTGRPLGVYQNDIGINMPFKSGYKDAGVELQTKWLVDLILFGKFTDGLHLEDSPDSGKKLPYKVLEQFANDWWTVNDPFSPYVEAVAKNSGVVIGSKIEPFNVKNETLPQSFAKLNGTDKAQWSNEALMDAEHIIENGQAGSANKAYIGWIHQLEKDTNNKRP